MPDSKGSKSSSKAKTMGAAAFTATAREALDAMETASRETIEATSKMGQETMSEAYEKALSFTTGNCQKSSEAFDAMVSEGKKTLDAVTSSTASVIGGMTACNSKFVDSLKGGLNFNLTYYEKLSGVEAPQEAAAISVKAFGEAVDLATAKSLEYGKIVTETYAKAYMPMKKRFDQSVSTFAKSLA